MTKIMLVEDDKNLRDIYGVRLFAEGYDIVSAGDGEEALAMAIKERPQLIISDVMMPKISGFDMLDILRSTTETKDIKVIMMTALSSDDQRQRGESLGADRYIVKSQVGIEDVVRVVHEVLGDGVGAADNTAAAPAASAPQPVPAPAAEPKPAAPTVPSLNVPPRPNPTPPAPTPSSMPVPGPQPEPAAPASPTPATPSTPPAAPDTPTGPVPNFADRPSTTSAPKPASSHNRVIQPIENSGSSTPDINELLDKELAREAGVSAEQLNNAPSEADEQKIIDEQLAQFNPPNNGPETPPPVGSSQPDAPSTPSQSTTPAANEPTPPVTPPAAAPTPPTPPVPPLPTQPQTSTPSQPQPPASA